MNENAIRLYNAITDIDNELIEKANQLPKKKRPPISKILLIAAAIAVLFVSGLSAYALANNTNIPSLLMKITGEGVEFEGFLEKLENTEADGYAFKDTKFAKDMEKMGISPVTVPEFFANSNFSFEEIPGDNEDISSYVIWAAMSFDCGEYKGNFSIEQYVEPPEKNGVSTMGFSDIKNGKIVKVNGMDVIVMEAASAGHLYYRDRNTIYVISIEGIDYETAIKIAQSIK